jgi:hypothetical protein
MKKEVKEKWVTALRFNDRGRAFAEIADEEGL